MCEYFSLQILSFTYLLIFSFTYIGEGMQLHPYRGQMSGVLLCHSQLYSHETGSLTKPGARLAAWSKLYDPSVSALYVSGITSTSHHRWLSTWQGCFELKSWNLLSKRSSLLSHLPSLFQCFAVRNTAAMNSLMPARFSVAGGMSQSKSPQSDRTPWKTRLCAGC